jgi:DNA-binding CsgD family transcriptional regulator
MAECVYITKAYRTKVNLLSYIPGLFFLCRTYMDTAQPSFTPIQLQAFLARAFQVADLAGFERLIRQYIKPVLRHEMMAACIGTFTGNHFTINRLVGVDYPKGILDSVPRVCVLSDRKALLEWVQTRKPLMIEPSTARQKMSAYELMEYDLLGLGHMAAHGLIDISGKMGSYFTFARVQAFDYAPTPLFMQLIAPHLHACMLRILGQSVSAASGESRAGKLSAAERHVLSWVAVGKSNKEIAQILGRSESTIKNQVHDIILKLGAQNRRHAAHLAFEVSDKTG